MSDGPSAAKLAQWEAEDRAAEAAEAEDEAREALLDRSPENYSRIYAEHLRLMREAGLPARIHEEGPVLWAELADDWSLEICDGNEWLPLDAEDEAGQMYWVVWIHGPDGIVEEVVHAGDPDLVADGKISLSPERATQLAVEAVARHLHRIHPRRLVKSLAGEFPTLVQA